jgi:hypothetical protein
MEAAILEATRRSGLEEKQSAENRKRLSSRPKPLFTEERRKGSKTFWKREVRKKKKSEDGTYGDQK